MKTTTMAATKLISFGRRILPCRKQIRHSSSLILPASSSFSTSTTKPSSWVTTKDLDEGIATIQLHRKPANTLSLEMCQEISNGIRTLADDNKTSVVILSSSLPNNIFSAGLDIIDELYKPDLDRLPKFWSAFQQLFLDLYGSEEITTIAAIEGPAPAAGCMLAISCDYRLMLDAEHVNIGLNESQLGIVAPPWMCQQYIELLGHRRAELALLQGTLFTPQQALEIGLVNELVNDDDESDDAVERASLAKAKELLTIPHSARIAVKLLTRTPLVTNLTNDRERDVDFFCEFVTQKHVQDTIRNYIEALKLAKKLLAESKKE